jgi:hypothetical protein
MQAMPNRPPIPAEVEREVLIEAGHRCAVCGADRPLEFAHIVAWSRSKDHSAGNLLCLCASCHQRADTEKWGTKTLRQYKQKPWIRTVRISTGPGGGESEALRPLHQIPPPPTDFTGRDAELAELRKAVEAGGATISGVRGMGGVGKTALALKLAEDLSPHYPDGGIFLDLKGVADEGQTPLTPSEIMAHVIRAFHPESRLPEGEAELSGHYQSVLHGRRVLLLMDNAAGASQVAPLSPPKGCLLLVTSRAHFTLPGLVARNLDELPHEDACDLLLRIAPRIGGAAGEIARLCDGLPIALRLAGGALSERPDLTPDSYLRQLTDEKKRLGLIDGPLKLSVQLLSGELKGLWCRLAVFPASFDAAAAAAVWGLELDPALDSLGIFVRSSLVDGEDGRYRLHDLARLFADNHLDEAGRRESQARHAEHYLQVVAAARDLYKKSGESLLAGLRLFDSEWANIQAG